MDLVDPVDPWTVLVVVQMFLEGVLVFLVLLGPVLRQPPLPFGLDVRTRLVGRGHAGRRQEPLQIFALTGLALRRWLLRPHERLEFMVARPADVLVKGHKALIEFTLPHTPAGPSRFHPPDGAGVCSAYGSAPGTSDR